MLIAKAKAESASSLNLVRALSCRWHGLATSQFTGVSREKRARKFRAQVHVAGKRHSVGYFSSEVDAALAFDERLRRLCPDPVRLKRSLNFPTQTEKLFKESPATARARALASHWAHTNKAELESFERFGDLFRRSHRSTEYEIIPVPGASRVDAIFQPKDSGIGLSLQLKASSPSRGCKETYSFHRTCGYDGMLLLLIPLDLDIIWAVPGSLITQKALQVRLGSKKDLSWRAHDISRTLVQCYERPESFPHVTLAEAALQTSMNHRMEEQAHRLMAKVFTFVELKLTRSFPASSAVDSVLSTGSFKWNVQEKATRKRKHPDRGRYLVHLSKHGGALGRIAYKEHDFDVLLVALLDTEVLEGMFVFPVHVLAEHELVGQRPRQLALYPPWSLPGAFHYRLRHAWQLEYFLDLRDWDGNSSLDAATQCRLLALVQNLPTRDNRTGARGKSCVDSGS